MSAVFFALASAGLVMSAIVTALAWKAGVIDQPNARSAHVKPTPRAGGLGIAAGLGAGLVAASLFPVGSAALAPIAGTAALFCALGLADDLVTLNEKIKFAAFVTLSLLMAWAAGPATWLAITPELSLTLPYAVGLLGSALFVFVTANAVNFMDGSDGMMAAVMIPASLALSLAGLVAGALDAALIGAGLAAGLFGFCVFNLPPARVFAGDCGSLLTGAAYAGGALAMAGLGFSGSLWLAPLFVLVFLADVLLTLLRRARQGRFSLSAHREHAYQRLIAAGWSHGRVALTYGALTSVIALTGLVAAQGPDGAVPAVFALWTLALCGLYAGAGRLTRPV